MSGSPLAQPSTLPAALPALRFGDDDVIIKLSPNPAENLLLHSSVLKAAMPQLAPALDDRWDQADEVIEPATGEVMKIYTLALRVVDGTFLLEGKEVVDLEDDGLRSRTDISPLHLSDLSTGDWPEIEGPNYAMTRFGATELIAREVSTAYRVLFALLYGYPLTLETICDPVSLFDVGRGRHGRDSLNPAMYSLSTLCALAEYHGALPCIAPLLTDLLLTYPSFWEDVAYRPASWMRLSVKLRSKDVYLDAARHLLARNDFQEIAAEFHITVEQAVSIYQPALHSLHNTVTKLRADLLSLGLTYHEYPYGGGRVGARVTLLQALEYRHHTQSLGEAACQRFDHIATSVFSEWMTKHVGSGERLFNNSEGKVRSTPLPGFAYAITKLSDAATWDQPANLFGRRTPARSADFFALGKRYNPTDRIRTTLAELVCIAAEYIEVAFRVYQTGSSEKTYTYRRAHFDGLNDIFTYLPLDEDDLPWANEVEWTQVTVTSVVSLRKASGGTLRNLQLTAEDGDEETEDGWQAWEADRMLKMVEDREAPGALTDEGDGFDGAVTADEWSNTVDAIVADAGW